MKVFISAALAALLGASCVQAQSDSGSHNPIVKSPVARTTRMAAKGRNSFTEAQAQSRVAKAGYSDVTEMMKNKNGVWQGKAMKDGAPVNVALDYKGAVTAH